MQPPQEQTENFNDIKNEPFQSVNEFVPDSSDKITNEKKVIEYYITNTSEINDENVISENANTPVLDDDVDTDYTNNVDEGAEIATRSDFDAFQKNKIVPVPATSTFKCNQCDKTFMDLRRLNRHKKIHLEEKPYNCKSCGKGFNERSDLMRHMSRHLRTKSSENESEYLFTCEECQTGFKYKQDLDIHLSVHTKTGVFSCNKCNKIFSSE